MRVTPGSPSFVAGAIPSNAHVWRMGRLLRELADPIMRIDLTMITTMSL